MSNKFYTTQEFKKLDKEWRQNLKSSGFQDLEEDSKEYSPLPISTAARTDSNRFYQREQIEQYYDLARGYLHTAKFKSDLHKKCWELHVEGHSEREIASMLNIGRTRVQRRITYCRKELFNGVK